MISKNSNAELVCTQYDAPGKKLGIKIALVTNLHSENYEPLISLLSKVSPDAILVAGDTLERNTEGITQWTAKEMERWQELPGTNPFVNKIMYLIDRLIERNGKQVPKEDNGLCFLGKASRIAPLFMSVGNHEWYFLPNDYQTFRNCGITLLDNRQTMVTIKGKQIEIGGLSTRYDMAWLKRFSKSPSYKILMCHDSGYYRKLIEKTEHDTFDLVLAGHYHGGQWKVFNRGVYIPRTGVFMKNTRGQFGKLIISAGTANTTKYPRFGNPCELVMISI